MEHHLSSHTLSSILVMKQERYVYNYVHAHIHMHTHTHTYIYTHTQRIWHNIIFISLFAIRAGLLPQTVSLVRLSQYVNYYQTHPTCSWYEHRTLMGCHSPVRSQHPYVQRDRVVTSGQYYRSLT